MKRVIATIFLASTAVLAACSPDQRPAAEASVAEPGGSLHTVLAGAFGDGMQAPAVAEPYARATVSTKLMGTITAVHVREGDRVRAGQPLVTIDARDLVAKGVQAEAGIAEAEAMRAEARRNAERMRALFVEDAAPRAQVDAAETALLRAESAVRAARAAGNELSATLGYAVVRAPFNGIITARMVDPGAFAAPGSTLVTVEDARRLRVVATAAPASVHALTRGARVQVRIENVQTNGVVEAVIPAAGNLYNVNVIVENPALAHMAGSAATILLPQAERIAIHIPLAAVHQQGDMTGVYVRAGRTTMLRWVQLGSRGATEVEVLAGLRAGEQIVIPAVEVGAQ